MPIFVYQQDKVEELLCTAVKLLCMMPEVERPITEARPRPTGKRVVRAHQDAAAHGIQPSPTLLRLIETMMITRLMTLHPVPITILELQDIIKKALVLLIRPPLQDQSTIHRKATLPTNPRHHLLGVINVSGTFLAYYQHNPGSALLEFFYPEVSTKFDKNFHFYLRLTVMVWRASSKLSLGFENKF